MSHVPGLVRVSFRRVSLLSAREEHPLVAARALMKLETSELYGLRKELFVFWKESALFAGITPEQLRAVAASATIVKPRRDDHVK